MSETNVLICSASRKVALVKSFQSALAQASVAGRVFAADIQPLSAAMRVGESVICPRSDAAGYASWLLDFCLTHSIKLVIPTRDEELELLARLYDSFRQKGILINISSSEVVRACNDKKRFYDYCAHKGIDTPKVYANGDARFPCFIKGRFGAGGRFAFRISDEKQLKVFEAMGQEMIVQEYIDWPEYTVDYFADFNGHPVSVVPRLRVSTFGGESFVGKTVKNPKVIQATIALASGLGLRGHNTVQLFFNPDDERIKFIEINPRFGGGAALGIAAGGQTPLYLLKYVLNQPVAPIVGEFQDGLYMLRYTDDIFIQDTDLKR